MNRQIAQFEFDDVQAKVTVTAIVGVSFGAVSLALFSPEGGECEAFLDRNAARTLANAILQACEVPE